MARVRPDHAPAPRQLTLDDWAEMLSVTREPAPEPAAEPEPVAVLVDALAPRLAEELSSRIPAADTSNPRSHRTATHPRRTGGRAAASETAADLEALALRAHTSRRNPGLREARRHALFRARAGHRLATRRRDHDQIGGTQWHEDRSSNAPAATTRSSTTSTASRNGRRSAPAAATPSAP